jgi:hypothetical protein
VPSYGSAYLLDEIAENARIEAEARGVEDFGSAGRRQRRLAALRPAANRVREAAIAKTKKNWARCDQAWSFCSVQLMWGGSLEVDEMHDSQIKLGRIVSS